MSKEMEPQGIIFQLEWKKRTGHSSRDEVASIGIWDTVDNSLDWTTFRSYLCQNLGTMEDISVAYVDSEGDELPIESECEFQEALKYARHRARKGREIILKLDGQGVPLSQATGKAPVKVREAKTKHSHKLTTKSGNKSSSVEKIRNSIVQASLMRPIIPLHRFTTAATGSEEKKVKVKKHAAVDDDDAGKLKKAVLDDLTARQEVLLKKLRSDWDDSPPQWFKKYMQKVKSEIIAEVTTNVLFANRQVVELVERRMQEYGTAPSTIKKSRKKKKNGSDDDSDCPQDSDLGSSKLLKKLEKLHKQEKKLDSKLEKLETKTKRRMEKKSLQQPLERKVSLVAKKKCSGSAGPYLMDAIVLYDEQAQVAEARALVGTAFTKVWEIMNNGTLPWTDKTELRLTWGTPGLEPEETSICCPILNPGERGHISINFKPPEVAGTFETYWHFYHMGKRFGHWLCCAVVVDSRVAGEVSQKVVDENKEEDVPHPAPPVPEAGAEPAAVGVVLAVSAADTGVQVQDREVGDYTNIYDDNSDSLTFMSDISTDLASEDDDNFVVVPMPACFKCDVPLDAVTEGSGQGSLIDNGRREPHNKFLQEFLSNSTTHQKVLQNENINEENGNDHDELVKVIMELKDLNLISGDCSHVNGENLASKLDRAKSVLADTEPPASINGEAAATESTEGQTSKSSMGDGVYVVDGSGHCTLLKKSSKHPDSPRSVFIFGSNGRLQKKSGDALHSSGKSKVGNDKKVYVVNEDGSCSLLEGESPPASQPVPEDAVHCRPDDVPNFLEEAKRMVQFANGGIIEYFREGDGMKSVFTSFRRDVVNPPAMEENVPQEISEVKHAEDGAWKSSAPSSALPIPTTAADVSAETTYARCFPTGNNNPSFSAAAYNVDVGIGVTGGMSTGFVGNVTNSTTAEDNNTVFSTAVVTETEFTAANNVVDKVSVVSSTRTDYPHDCPLARKFNDPVGVSPVVNNGACFTVPDVGVGYSPIENVEGGMAMQGVTPMTFTTAGNSAPLFSASGVASANVGNQRTAYLTSINGETYLLDPKMMNLPPMTNTVPVTPGDARTTDYYVSPGNYYEPLVYEDRYFAGPQTGRFGMQPSNSDNHPEPVGTSENYFEPTCCGPNTQPVTAEAGNTANSSKPGGPTVDMTVRNQFLINPTPVGCHPLMGHVPTFPPPPLPPFSYLPPYRPYSTIPPSPVPVVEPALVQSRRYVPPFKATTEDYHRTTAMVLNSLANDLRNPCNMQGLPTADDFRNLVAMQTNLQRLREMGFLNHQKNMALLRQHGNDLQQAVTELLTQRENADPKGVPNVYVG